MGVNKQMLAIAVSALVSSAMADTPAEIAANRVCAAASKNINSLIDFASSACVGPKGGEDAIFVTRADVFSDSYKKKAYLLVVVGATADAMKKQPGQRIRTISIMDTSLGKQRAVFQIPSSEAVRLHSAAFDGRIPLDAMYAGILKAGAVKPIK